MTSGDHGAPTFPEYGVMAQEELSQRPSSTQVMLDMLDLHGSRSPIFDGKLLAI